MYLSSTQQIHGDMLILVWYEHMCQNVHMRAHPHAHARAHTHTHTVMRTLTDKIILLLSVLSAIPENITSSLPGIVYECVARVNNAIGNERVMFPWYCAQNGQ